MTIAPSCLALCLLLGPAAVPAHAGGTSQADLARQVVELKAQVAQLAGHEEFSATTYDYVKELTAHQHNKIVHFPVALSLVAFLFALLSLRWPGFHNPTRVLVFLAAAGAWAAKLTGPKQEMEFLMSPLKPILHQHAQLGTYSAYALTACFLLGLVPGSRKWLWLVLLLVAALVSVTGYFGGILATA